MPYESWGCGICGAQAPKEYRKHGKMAQRMRWLREHREKHHPKAFKASIKKGLKTRKRKK